MTIKIRDYSAEESARISALMKSVCSNPESSYALEHLVFCLETARTERDEEIAWECFNDRIAAVISRLK